MAKSNVLGASNLASAPGEVGYMPPPEPVEAAEEPVAAAEAAPEPEAAPEAPAEAPEPDPEPEPDPKPVKAPPSLAGNKSGDA